MKKHVLSLIIILICMASLLPLRGEEKLDWQREMQYIPTRTDIYLSINFKDIRSFFLRSGISEEEMMKFAAGAGGAKSLKNTMYRSFLNKLTKIVLVADPNEFKKKKPKQFLILVEGPDHIPDMEKNLQKVKKQEYRGYTIYEIEAADKAFFCKINGLYLIGYKAFIEEFLHSRSTGKRTISPRLVKVLKNKKNSGIFLHVPLARLLEQKLKSTIALGKGMGGSGFNDNVFIRSLMNLQYITAEIIFNDKLSLNLFMYGRGENDARNLTMFNHFLIVGSSLAIPFANKLSKSVTRKNMNFKNDNLRRVQQIIGRIKTVELKNGTGISFTLTGNETEGFLAQIRAGLKKSLAERKAGESGKFDVFAALKKNDLVSLRTRIKGRRDARRKNSRGETLLYKAVQGGNLEAVKLLMQKGAGINDRNDSDRRTSMHAAAAGKNEEIVILLIEKGAKVNIRDTFGYFPLHLAVKRGNLPMIKLILAGGGKVNVATLDGETPLHIAAGMGNVRVIRLLLEAGGLKNSRDFYGETPLDRARKGNHKGAMEALR